MANQVSRGTLNPSWVPVQLDSEALLLTQEKHLMDYEEEREKRKKMREVFVEVSGYHTLKKEYEYLRDMDTEGRFKDHQTAGFKNIFLPLIRGRTKVQMMSALIQGVDSHKEQYVSALNSIALLSALLLPVTLELVNMPLDEIKDPTSSRFCHFLELRDRLDTNAHPIHCWNGPLVYNYAAAISVCLSFCDVLIASFAGLWHLNTSRDADWIRMMSRYGDCILQFAYLSFVGSITCILTIVGGNLWTLFATQHFAYSLWLQDRPDPLPALDQQTVDYVEKYVPLGTAKNIPIVYVILYLPIMVTWMLAVRADRYGAIDSYWMSRGETVTPKDKCDLDSMIRTFKYKMELAQKLATLDEQMAEAKNREKRAGDNSPQANGSSTQRSANPVWFPSAFAASPAAPFQMTHVS